MIFSPSSSFGHVSNMMILQILMCMGIDPDQRNEQDISQKTFTRVCKNSFIISIWLDSLKVIYRKIIRPQRYGISVVHVWSQKSNFTRSNMTQMVVYKFNCCSCRPSLKCTLITFRLGTVSPIRVWITIGCNRCRCRRRQRGITVNPCKL